MIKVLLISGKKKAGKDTVANYLVNNKSVFPQEIFRTGCGLGDIYTEATVKKYGFADKLKVITADLLDFPYEWTQTQEGKERFVEHILWENLPHYHQIQLNCLAKGELPPTGPMRVREILQEYGTGISRKMYPGIWARQCRKAILSQAPFLATCADVRFPDEIDIFKSQEFDTKIIRLTRNVNDPNDPATHHISETALDNYDKFDAIIENHRMTEAEANHEVLKALALFGWINF